MVKVPNPMGKAGKAVLKKIKVLGVPLSKAYGFIKGSIKFFKDVWKAFGLIPKYLGKSPPAFKGLSDFAEEMEGLSDAQIDAMDDEDQIMALYLKNIRGFVGLAAHVSAEQGDSESAERLYRAESLLARVEHDLRNR